ncbi:erythromycin esterase family protein [Streptomyces scopuliridis]|uniref:erythromycin esterase family protein n=1 Tax=Streptomyces scopuliridis TaxID=452529 RepID=UPI002DD8C12A|nr:erythromycin esterase family protein [Streptomyces scopuliridis]WSB37756.1 erythromycin esterase family protein [Streptomyces scopuliridis]
MTRNRPALLIALLLCLGTLVAVSPASPASAAGSLPGSPSDRAVVAAIDRVAHPLRTTEPYGDTADLRPLDKMIRDAKVVGLGEATHSSREFFTMKHRVLRHLVERKGFRTFGLEASWSTGLRLNDYVLHGKGDPRRIMRDEFQDTYLWWNNTEYLELIEWMRGYNRLHPRDPLRFMGDDFAYAGPELYGLVTGYVAKTRPELLARFTELYRGLPPTTSADAYMKRYLTLPLAEREEMAARTGRALELLRRQPAGTGAQKEAYAWAVRHATAIDQTARGYAFDFEDQERLAAAMRYRDGLMADNVAWWQRQTGDKVLLSAHNAHVSYVTSDPLNYPKMQGAFLRDRLGADYVSVGFTFDRGSFNATAPDGPIRVFTVGPAGAGSNEALLDRVRHRDYFLDIRTAPAVARNWLDTARPTRSIGTAYPEPERAVPLARSHDILFHLHRVGAAELRVTP